MDNERQKELVDALYQTKLPLLEEIEKYEPGNQVILPEGY